MSTKLDVAPVDASTDDAGIDHVVCGRNDDIALCGTSVADEPWVDADLPTTCVVCDDLELTEDFCPLGGVCDCGEEA